MQKKQKVCLSAFIAWPTSVPILVFLGLSVLCPGQTGETIP